MRAPDTGTPSPKPDPLELQVQELLHSYDVLLAEIVAEPEAATNPDHPLYDRLRRLATRNSPTIQPVINALVAAGSRGERQVAHGGADLPFERRLLGDVDVASKDTLSVSLCVHLNYMVFDRDNQGIEVVEGYVEPSSATLARVDGELRIHRFDALDDDRCAPEDQ